MTSDGAGPAAGASDVFDEAGRPVDEKTGERLAQLVAGFAEFCDR